MEPNTPERTPNPKRKPSPEITKRGALSPLDIEEGPGFKLKEIPNVSEKLSKAEVDKNMQFLHQLLYGTKKAKNLMENILEFSGFSGGEHNEKRMKRNAEEKLVNCPDSRLLYLCNVLDIPGVNNPKMSKLGIVDELVEFLELPCPHGDDTSEENAEDDSERGISEERSSDPETDAENQERVQSEDEGEDGDDEKEEQSESAHESDLPKDEDEVEDGGDEEEGDQSESDHENDEPKYEDELEDGGDEEEGDQSESAHENNEPKDEEDSTEAQSKPEENPPVNKGSTSSK